MSRRLVLEPIPGRYAVCRFAPDAEVPSWALAAVPQSTGHAAMSVQSRLISITRTADELSIVAPQELVDSMPPVAADFKVERDFIAWRIAGTLDFLQVGVLAKLTAALADAGVPVFVISTFDTDVLLVRAADAARAIESLNEVAIVSRAAGLAE